MANGPTRHYPTDLQVAAESWGRANNRMTILRFTGSECSSWPF
jgi:hypothetical protein